MLFVLLFLPGRTKSQTVREWWLSMPDTLISYMNKSKRVETLDYVDMGIKNSVTNLLNGDTRIDTLTNDYMKVSLSEVCCLEMKILPSDTDSVVCVVKTFKGEEPESVATIFDRNWNKLRDVLWDINAESYIQRPDTMSEMQYNELKTQFEPVMISASLSMNGNFLLLKLSTPLLLSTDSYSIKALLKQRKLKWDGEIFREC
jgi:Protein of unknown function (DUF3256).